jgi:hypothetical protein
MGDALRVEAGPLGAAQRRFTSLGDELGEAAAPVAAAGDTALSGAGQFAGDLETGVVTFALSWRAVLDVFGESATAVGRLIGHTLAETAAADERLAQRFGPR